MDTLLLVIHLMVAAAMIAVILLQRSEGGALGIGGGGGGFMTGRSAANLLTKTTTVLAALFFLTSISLAIISVNTGPKKSVLERITTDKQTNSAPAAKKETPEKAKPAENTDKKPAAPSAPISQ